MSMGFFRQECWSGLPFPPPGDLPNPEIEPASPALHLLQADSVPAEPLGKPHSILNILYYTILYYTILYYTILYINPLFLAPLHTLRPSTQTLCIWALIHRYNPICCCLLYRLPCWLRDTFCISLTSVNLFCSFSSKPRTFILRYGHVSCCFSSLEFSAILC